MLRREVGAARARAMRQPKTLDRRTGPRPRRPLGLSLALGVLAVLTGCGPNLQAMSSGFIGCPPSEIAISDENDSSGTWTAACRGRTFYCTNIVSGGAAIAYGPNGAVPGVATTTQVACSPAAPLPAAPARDSSVEGPVAYGGDPMATGRVPAGAAGFSFAEDVALAEKRCSDAGHAWQALDAGRFTCSGALAAVGVPASVHLGTRDGVVREITLDAGADSPGWKELVARYGKLRQRIEGNYGEQRGRSADPLDDCSGDLKECFARGRARVEEVWRWPSGHSISITLDGRSPGERPILQVVHRDGATIQDTAPEPAKP
jgi:hypothetical protein